MPQGPSTIFVNCCSSCCSWFNRTPEKARSDQTRWCTAHRRKTDHLICSGRYLSLVPKAISLIFNNLRTIPLQNSITASGMITRTKTSTSIQIQMNSDLKMRTGGVYNWCFPRINHMNAFISYHLCNSWKIYVVLSSHGRPIEWLFQSIVQFGCD